MNSTTSISSARTSSTPATSAQPICDFVPRTMLAGVVRGIIPAVFQSSQTMTMTRAKKASGNQVVAKFAN